MSSLIQVNNMKEMRDFLETYLLKIVDEDEEDEYNEEIKSNKKIKTYIIESNIANPKEVLKNTENSAL